MSKPSEAAKLKSRLRRYFERCDTRVRFQPTATYISEDGKYRAVFIGDNSWDIYKDGIIEGTLQTLLRNPRTGQPYLETQDV